MVVMTMMMTMSTESAIRRAKVNLATTALSPLTIIKVIVTQTFQYFKVIMTQIFFSTHYH